MSESQTPRTDAEWVEYYRSKLLASEKESDWLTLELSATRARLAELEGIADRLYKTAKELSKVSSLLPREKVHLKAYEVYKEGKK